ncbi:MAG: hypothetical protein OEV08_08850 [Nitrospira sp.]|nr:hypothetical protein [Nitrospira sp.]
MTLAMLESPQLSYGAVPTRGASTEARYIEKQSEEGRRRLREAHSIGLGVYRAFEELFVVARECGTQNWDGYGAQAVQEETSRQAHHFLEALPLGIPVPTVGAEADGHLTLEWYKNPARVLSVSISPNGMLYYAALIGTSKRSGTEPFLGEVPEDILHIIRRVFSA